MSIIIRLSFYLFMIGSCCIAEEPWGKDANLAYKPKSFQIPTCKTPILTPLMEKLIVFHQTTISSADGPRSHFRPTSSQYMLDAIKRYGFFKGFSMGCDRLLRENEEKWIYPEILDEEGELFKFDPVR